ncbi:hypothetical protein [Actinokineospora enzanensis]|uniref:hypothetical protein n=1 Tax=Actinokineospora enzanensis TaxID=155975 RepID=UPI00036AAD4D|nr:hypothetical protein [Actinokineospora enzanensis]
MRLSDDEQDESDSSSVPDEVHTICFLCGGGGAIADAKLAVVGGQPRTVDNGRPCALCATEGNLAGIVPPV